MFFKDTFRYVRDGEGRITHFKVMLHPLQAINLIYGKMGAMLQAKARCPSSRTAAGQLR